MKKQRLIAVLLSLVMLLSLCACGAQKPAEQPAPKEETAAQEPQEAAPQEAGEYEITDLMGRKVTVPADAEKFACIGPGTLRLYCYIADEAQLVGLEDVEVSWGSEGRPYSMAIENKENFSILGPGGPGNAPDAELLFTLEPDVIFSGYNSDISVLDELQDKTGIPVLAVSYGQTELFDPQVYETFTMIGKVTHNEERAEAVIKYFEDAKADLMSRTEGIEDRARVYLACQSNRGAHGIESTTGNYALFDAVNAIDVVEEEAGITDYIMLDKEKLLELDPDNIIMDAGGLSIVQEDYAKNPEFYDSLSAFKNGRVFLQMPYNYYYTNLEIALADAYYIGAMLYPEAFSDIDPAAKFDEISQFFVGIPTYEQIAEESYGGFQQVVLSK